MSGHPTGVYRNATFELIEVLLKCLPVPIDLLQRRKRHALDSTHHLLQVFGFFFRGSKRGEREPAITSNDGGNAVIG